MCYLFQFEILKWNQREACLRIHQPLSEVNMPKKTSSVWKKTAWNWCGRIIWICTQMKSLGCAAMGYLISNRNSSQAPAKLRLRVPKIFPEPFIASWNVLCSKSLFSLLVCLALLNILLILSCRVCRDGTHRNLIIYGVARMFWPLHMDGGPRRKSVITRPPSWEWQKAVVAALLSMKSLWDIHEDDPK